MLSKHAAVSIGTNELILYNMLYGRMRRNNTVNIANSGRLKLSPAQTVGLTKLEADSNGAKEHAAL